MAENAWIEKLVTAIVANMMSDKEQDLTFNLEDAEIKTPMFSEPLKVSGKLTVQLSSRKKSKK